MTKASGIELWAYLIFSIITLFVLVLFDIPMIGPILPWSYSNGQIGGDYAPGVIAILGLLCQPFVAIFFLQESEAGREFIVELTLFYWALIGITFVMFSFQFKNPIIPILLPLSYFASPFIVVLTRTRSTEHIGDKKLLDVAMKYGVLTKTVVIYETETSLEEAEKILKRFEKHGVAKKLTIGGGGEEGFIFPSALAQLLKVDKLILDEILGLGGIAGKTELLKRAGVSIEALDEALKRLESNGIVVYDTTLDQYRLRAITIK